MGKPIPKEVQDILAAVTSALGNKVEIKFVEVSNGERIDRTNEVLGKQNEAPHGEGCDCTNPTWERIHRHIDGLNPKLMREATDAAVANDFKEVRELSRIGQLVTAIRCGKINADNTLTIELPTVF